MKGALYVPVPIIPYLYSKVKNIILFFLFFLLRSSTACHANDGTTKSILIKVKDSRTGEPIPGVEIHALIDSLAINARTDSNGLAGVTIDGELKLRISKNQNDDGERYFATSVNVSPASPDTVVVALERLGKNMVGRIPPCVQFAAKGTTPDNSSMNVLQMLLKIMQDNPVMEVELSAHADNHSERSSAQRISQKRYETVRNWLVEKGISKNRIIGTGYGCSRLKVPGNDTIEDAINRRVEIRILKF